MRTLMVFTLFILVTGCNGHIVKSNTNRIGATIYSDGNEVIFVNPKNWEPLRFEECSDDPKSKDPRPCDIFVDEFRTEKIKEFVIIDSIKVDNTKCCRTIIMDGVKKTRCREFPSSITSCPSGWYIF